jgi:hypothetical protein
MKTLRNTLFVDSTDAIVEKMAVMTTTATEEMVGLNMFWYFPIISFLKRWFVNKNESELLWWHKEKQKQEVGLIRHPADATQW